MVNRQLISDEVWNDNYKAPGEKCLMDTWIRQAKACSDIEDENIRQQIYDKFLWLLTDFKGIAGGRITANLGVEGRTATSLYNCFVHNPSDINYKDPDSIEGIYDMLKAQALTLKSEGGYGMNFSWIRPSGSYVKGIGGRTPGVLKFMELWDKSSEVITMGSEKVLGKKGSDEKRKIRKGAQMGILCCTHPEIEDFIIAKQTEGRFSKFNISVGITQGFMEAVEQDLDWDLIFPDTSIPEYKQVWGGDIENWKSRGLPIIVHKTIKAKDLWDKIMKSTYNRNDPGVIFLDIANKFNPLNYAENIATTNPCGEIGMSNGVCLLFSLNLIKYIKKESNKFEFDFETFKKANEIAVRFADNINDISRVPINDYKKSIKDKRRIGIGVLGLGSLLAILGIRYGSEEAIDLVENIFKIKAETELLTSAKLGKEKGSFPLFDKEKFFNTYWWKTLPISESVKKEIEDIGCMRNSHRSANAPTGNMSIYAGVLSGGIEPMFMLEYVRWSIVHEVDRQHLREQGFKFPDVFKGEWFETDILKKSKAGTDEILIGNFNGIDYQIDRNRGLTKKSIVEDWAWSFIKENFSQEEIDIRIQNGLLATSNELSHKEHINMLKVIAKYIDMNSSKTINLPNNYSYEDFKNIYMEAWKSGIKGVTTYRDGTMTAVLESSNKENHNIERTCPKRPKELPCNIHIAKVNGQKWVVIIGLLNDNPYEIFSGPMKFSESVATKNLLSGFDVKNGQSGFIIKCKRGEYQLQINGEIMYAENENGEHISNIVDVFDDPSSAWATRLISMSIRHGVPISFICDQLNKDGFITDVNKVLSRILKKYVLSDKKVEKTCPSCGSKNIKLDEGCLTCMDCSYGKCG